MKRTSKTTRKSLSWPIAIGLVVLVILILGVGYLVFHPHRASAPSPTPAQAPVGQQHTPTMSESEASGNAAKTSSNPAQVASGDATDTKSTAKATSSPAPTIGNATLTILRVNQSGTLVSVRSIVSGATGGTCQYTFTSNSGQTVTQTNSLAQDTTSTDCNIDIAASQFSGATNWTATVSLANGGPQASGQQSFTVTQ